MQADEPSNRATCLPSVILGVFLSPLLDLPEGLIRGVTGKHIYDESLLDGLPHGIEMERLVYLRLGIQPAEQFKRASLRRRREGKVGQVRLVLTPSTGCPGELLLDRINGRGQQAAVLRFSGGELLFLSSSKRKVEVLG